MNNSGQSKIRQVMLAGGSVFIASAIALIARPDLFGEFIGIVEEAYYIILEKAGKIKTVANVIIAYNLKKKLKQKHSWFNY